MEAYLEREMRFLPLLRDETLFFRMRVTPLGNGLEWDENTCIPAETLYGAGQKLPLEAEDFLCFTKHRTLDTAKLSERLHCSRQYIKQLTEKGKLSPIRSGAGYTLFPAREAE